MKSRLQKEGKWKGASHKVPEREEGEPSPKIAKNDDLENTDQASPDTDPEMPPLEEPETPEGMCTFIFYR